MEGTDRDFLKKMIQSEHSRPQAHRILNWIGADETRVAALVSVFLESDHRTTQCAAWPLGDLGARSPGLLAPHLPELLVFLKKKDSHVAIARNILRLLEKMELPLAHLGDIADLAFSFAADPNEKVAIRAFSLTVAWRVCLIEPELANELRHIIEENLPHSTPAFRVRGKKILAEMKKLGL